MAHAYRRLVEHGRNWGRGESQPRMMDRQDISERAKALETQAGFVVAFRLFGAALA